MTDYLTVIDVLAIHHDQIERYGGSHGIRDAGLLESALHRPKSGYYPDLIAESAALWESLSHNHPFIDGNKRTAFACAYTFLAINGLRLRAPAVVTEAFLVKLYESGGLTKDRLEAWLCEVLGPPDEDNKP
jgi:death-on-curing protein